MRFEIGVGDLGIGHRPPFVESDLVRPVIGDARSAGMRNARIRSSRYGLGRRGG